MTFLWATGSDDLLKEVKLKLGGVKDTLSRNLEIRKVSSILYKKKFRIQSLKARIWNQLKN